MLPRTALPLLLCLSLALPTLAQDGAPKRLLGEDLQGLEAVGRVNIQGAGFCTGVLVAPDLVLTAAHCLFHPRSARRVAEDRVHFVAAWRKGAYAAHGRVIGAALPEGYAYTPRPDGRALAYDIALLRLDAPLDLEPMPLANLADAPFAVLSYGRGRAHVPTLQDPCRKTGRAAAVLQLTCAIVPGSSGAPVLQAGPQGYRVVAVVSARASGAQGPRALAVPALPLVTRLRARLAAAPQ